MEIVMKTISTRVLILLTVMLSACASGNYGTSTKNFAVDRIFLSGMPPQGYQYYYNGVKLEPSAILGVRPELTLNPSKFWTKIEIDDRQLSEWRSYFKMSYMWPDPKQQGSIRFQGIQLNDPQGNEAGILYSRYDWVVTEFPGDGVIIVHPPQPQPIMRNSAGRF